MSGWIEMTRRRLSAPGSAAVPCRARAAWSVQSPAPVVRSSPACLPPPSHPAPRTIRATGSRTASDRTGRTGRRTRVPQISFVSWLLYFTCMKNRMTSVALRMAMPSATGKFSGPRLMNATVTVIGGEHHQRSEDRVIRRLGRDVARHASSPGDAPCPRGTAAETGRSRRCRRSASTAPTARPACTTRARTARGAPSR